MKFNFERYRILRETIPAERSKTLLEAHRRFNEAYLFAQENGLSAVFAVYEGDAKQAVVGMVGTGNQAMSLVGVLFDSVKDSYGLDMSESDA